MGGKKGKGSRLLMDMVFLMTGSGMSTRRRTNCSYTGRRSRRPASISQERCPHLLGLQTGGVDGSCFTFSSVLSEAEAP